MHNLRNPTGGDKINKAQLEKLQKEYDEAKKAFATVFNTPQGEKVIELLNKYANYGFPDYNNVNQTYAQIGKQKLVEKINIMREIKK